VSAAQQAAAAGYGNTFLAKQLRNPTKTRIANS
jgi:hypothetical protein